VCDEKSTLQKPRGALCVRLPGRVSQAAAKAFTGAPTRVHLPAAERTWHTSSGINAAREREYFTSQVLRADN